MLDFPGLAKKHIGLFEAGGVFAIQRIDETSPDDYTDEDAVRDVVAMARQGDCEAIAILHLEGWSVNAKSHIEFVEQLHSRSPVALSTDSLTE